METKFDFAISEVEWETIRALERLAEENKIKFDFVTAILTLKFLKDDKR